jgi:outer membrane protein assembly factor BamD (BamD/ComL family)
MYDQQPEAHAEAVANLAKLFIEVHKPDHAKDMKKILEERYQNSRWAKAGVK